jgi:UDP-glucose 4-epimerase
MKVLVAGGAGFIGFHTVRALRAAGCLPVVVDNLSRSAYLPPQPFYRVDLLSFELKGLLQRERPKAVIHLAAQPDVGLSVADPLLDARENILASLNLLQGCVAAGAAKVIFASSAAVYGEPKRLPIDEEHPCRPTSPYGAAKLSVEHYLRVFRTLHGLEYTILRYANVYGPRQGLGGEGGVVAAFCRRLGKGLGVKIYGDGEQTRDFIYVEDVARANVLALTKGDGETLNISSGEEVTINRLSRLLQASFPGSPAPSFHSPRRGDLRRSILDPSRARRVLGWSPQVSLQEGLFETARFYQDFQWRPQGGGGRSN